MRRLVFWFLCLLPALVWADAGEVRFVSGDVKVQRVDGRTEALQRGSKVFEGDTVVTGYGYAQLAMVDDAVIVVRPETRFKFEAYRFARSGDDRSVINLLRGGFRTLTGLIGRQNRDRVAVKTATATIGIRGTDHEPLYIPPPEPGETPIGEPGTYDKVYSGETYLETAAGRVELAANQVGFAAARPDAVPQRLPQVPAFMREGTELRREARQQREQEREQRQTRREILAAVIATATASELPRANTSTGFDLRALPSNTYFLPSGVVAVGGDVSNGTVGNGAGIVGQGNNAVLMNGLGQPLTIVNEELTYVRGRAEYVAGGSTRIDDKPLVWGVYAGGAINDAQGPRSPTYFYYMGGGEATSAANLSAALPQAGGVLTFNSVAAYTKPVTESGSLGGSVNSVAVEIKNLLGVPVLSRYDLGVTDGQGRTWSAALTSPQTMRQFLGGQGAVNLDVVCRACPRTGGNGIVQGWPVGNPIPSGVVSSYTLKAGGAAVGGAVLAR